MPNPFPFVYQCVGCGAVKTVTKSDTARVDGGVPRPRFAADRALREVYGWASARPDSRCPECDVSE